MRGNSKKLIKGGIATPPGDEDIDIESTLMFLYKKCAKEWGWVPKDIDETNLETLMDFLFFKELADPNTRIINGKTYKRATKPPSWL